MSFIVGSLISTAFELEERMPLYQKIIHLDKKMHCLSYSIDLYAFIHYF